VEGDHLCIKVYDRGAGFELKEVHTPDFDTLDESGRGIFVIRKLMDTVSYHKCAGGNVLEMHRNLASADH
jgi:serine/threonine-protein kinase RsbW